MQARAAPTTFGPSSELVDKIIIVHQEVVHLGFLTVTLLAPFLCQGAEHVVRGLEVALVAYRSMLLGQFRIGDFVYWIVEDLVKVVSIGWDFDRRRLDFTAPVGRDRV
jgi:hypothetical protein